MQTEHATTEQLSALLDGELDEQERDAVGAHLAQCEICQVELERLRGAVMLLRALPLSPPRGSFHLAETEHPGIRYLSRPDRFGPHQLWRGLAAMAAALMVLVFTVDTVRPNFGFRDSADTLSAPSAALRTTERQEATEERGGTADAARRAPAAPVGARAPAAAPAFGATAPEPAPAASEAALQRDALAPSEEPQAAASQEIAAPSSQPSERAATEPGAPAPALTAGRSAAIGLAFLMSAFVALSIVTRRRP